jgi:hypothetical protein
MDQSKHEVSNDPLLDRLVARASNQLEKLRYSRRSLRRYRTIWRHLAAFSRQTNPGGEYSEDLAARFSEAYRMRDGECLQPGERWRRHVVIGLKVLGGFAREGSVERLRIDRRSIRVPAQSIGDAEFSGKPKVRPMRPAASLLSHALHSSVGQDRFDTRPALSRPTCRADEPRACRTSSAVCVTSDYSNYIQRPIGATLCIRQHEVP